MQGYNWHHARIDPHTAVSLEQEQLEQVSSLVCGATVDRNQLSPLWDFCRRQLFVQNGHGDPRHALPASDARLLIRSQRGLVLYINPYQRASSDKVCCFFGFEGYWEHEQNCYNDNDDSELYCGFHLVKNYLKKSNYGHMLNTSLKKFLNSGMITPLRLLTTSGAPCPLT